MRVSCSHWLPFVFLDKSQQRPPQQWPKHVAATECEEMNTQGEKSLPAFISLSGQMQDWHTVGVWRWNSSHRLMCLKTWCPAGDVTGGYSRTFKRWDLAGRRGSLGGKEWDNPYRLEYHRALSWLLSLCWPIESWVSHPASHYNHSQK